MEERVADTLERPQLEDRWERLTDRLEAFAVEAEAEARLLLQEVAGRSQPDTLSWEGHTRGLAGVLVEEPDGALVPFAFHADPGVGEVHQGQAGQTVARLCQQVTERYGAPLEERLRTALTSREPTAMPSFLAYRDILDAPDTLGIYDVLAGLSEEGRFIRKDSPQWHTIAPLVETLVRNPNVTADAYRPLDPDRNEQYFLQWCTAMVSFKARLAGGARVQGGELLFVEDWHDALVPGRREPLTNSVWQDALSKIKLQDLQGWCNYSAW